MDQWDFRSHYRVAYTLFFRKEQIKNFTFFRQVISQGVIIRRLSERLIYVTGQTHLAVVQFS